jgi:DNA-directed RNA polymerase specialized sigma24 family protein
VTIDIKKLLYDYRKNEVKLSNIQASLSRTTYEYPSCTPAYNDDIKPRGGLPQSQTERFALHNVMEVGDKRDKLMRDAKHVEEALTLVRNAIATLNQKQRDLIDLRYFQDRQPAAVAPLIEVSVDHYWKLHKIAYEGIEKCLNGGEIEVGNNPFIPKKKKKDENNQKIAKNTTNQNHEIAV